MDRVVPSKIQYYRLEVRWDFEGTEAEAFAEAQHGADLVGGCVTDVMDKNWDTVGEDSDE